jgi:hypothetical protein
MTFDASASSSDDPIVKYSYLYFQRTHRITGGTPLPERFDFGGGLGGRPLHVRVERPAGAIPLPGVLRIARRVPGDSRQHGRHPLHHHREWRTAQTDQYISFAQNFADKPANRQEEEG